MGGPTADSDYAAWAKAQSETIRRNAGALAEDGLDAAHLADEIAARSDAGRLTVEAMARMAVVALLVLEWSGEPAIRAPLRRQLRAARGVANAALAHSPSLQEDVDPEESFLDCRRIARAMIEDSAFLHDIMPMHCPYTPEQILDPAFEPANRQGLE